MQKNTKEMISQESLRLFSIYGYEGVSTKAIADAVWIKDSSLYNHFKGKKAIFDELQVQYQSTAEKMNIKAMTSTFIFSILRLQKQNQQNHYRCQKKSWHLPKRLVLGLLRKFTHLNLSFATVLRKNYKLCAAIFSQSKWESL